MPRPRTPTKILELRGAFKKDPNRKRTDPESQGPIGRAPRNLTAKEQAIWREVIRIAPVGVLTVADRLALEEMVSLIHERRTNLANMPVAKRNLLRGYLGQFGMTPADRSKINVSPRKPSNRFEGL